MIKAHTLEEWRDRLVSDALLIKKSGIRPMAIVLRLEEAAYGPVGGNDHWYGFDTPGRGQSRYKVVQGQHIITLEFRHRAAARVTHEALMALKEKFEAIHTISFREHTERDGATLSLELTGFTEA